MSTVLHDAKPQGNPRSTISEPAAEHPGLWSVVQRAHHARLICSGGPDYRSFIVDYEVDGCGIEVELPMREVVPGDLDGRVVTMEILDDYLSLTVEHVHVVGRVQEWDGGAAGARRARGRSRVPGGVHFIAVQPLTLQAEG